MTVPPESQSPSSLIRRHPHPSSVEWSCSAAAVVGATSTGAANTAAWFVIEDTEEEVVTASEASLVVFLKRLFQAGVKNTNADLMDMVWRGSDITYKLLNT